MSTASIEDVGNWLDEAASAWTGISSAADSDMWAEVYGDRLLSILDAVVIKCEKMAAEAPVGRFIAASFAEDIMRVITKGAGT